MVARKRKTRKTRRGCGSAAAAQVAREIAAVSSTPAVKHTLGSRLRQGLSYGNAALKKTRVLSTLAKEIPYVGEMISAEVHKRGYGHKRKPRRRGRGLVGGGLC